MQVNKKTVEEEALEKLRGWSPEGPDTLLLDGQRTLDADTQGLINEQLERAYTPKDVLEKQGLLGTEDYSPTSKGSESLKAKSMGSDPSTVEALEKRAAQKHGNFMTGLKNDVSFQSTLKKSDTLARATKNLGNYEQLKLNNWKQKQLALDAARQLREQRDAERSSFLSSLLGVIGTVGGALVGGPVGAAAGGAAGKAAGEA